MNHRKQVVHLLSAFISCEVEGTDVGKPEDPILRSGSE